MMRAETNGNIAHLPRDQTLQQQNGTPEVHQ